MPDDICREENPIWVSGMCYVDSLDVESTLKELKAKGIRSNIECERCGGKFVPGVSFDPYE